MIEPNHSSLSRKSDEVKLAVIGAMEEEKHSRLHVYGKAVARAFLLAAFLSTIIYAFWSDHFNMVWSLGCIVVWISLTVAFLLHASPQVRLSVRGYWSMARIGVFLGGMTVVTAIQLILCPHFALVHLANDSPFRFFDYVTDFYMSLGGMKICMFLCGMTFAVLGTAFASFPISKQLAFSRFRSIAMIVALGLFAQTPVIILQLSSESTRSFFVPWVSGSALGILSVALTIKYLAEKTRLHESRKDFGKVSS